MRLQSVVSTALAALVASSLATPLSQRHPPSPSRRRSASSASKLSLPHVRDAALATAESSFAVTEGPPLTFNYSTSEPDAENWIGIWNVDYGGPDDQVSVQPSLAWDWAREAEASVLVDASKLQPGRYKAYFLAKGGYQWLASPIEVVVPGSPGPSRFLASKFTTKNGRVGESFKAVISGLLANAGDGKTTYSIVDRDAADWVSISQDGTITGTPTGKSVSKFVVVATGSDGTTARLPITIPIADSQAPLVEELKVMTFNIWMGGKNVKDSHRKQVNFLAESNVDIVGLQESDEGDSSRLAHALGWHGWKGKESRDVSIISRYPIVEHFSGTSAAGAVRIAADGNDSQVIVWNAHLGYDPYGPYDFCFSRFDDDTVLEREKESGRTPQITEIVDRMRDHIDDYANIPVILTGDFNAPSHLDWTDKTADQHCGIGAFDWPSSVLPTDAGLVDSFREMHPDPLAEPGITWSPIYKDNEGRDEPMDRIDFVYHRGMETLSSEVLVVGDPAAEPNHADNEWPSDHAAVMTTFKIPSKR